MRTIRIQTIWKRCLCLGLAVMMLLAVLSACVPGKTVPTYTVSPENTETPGEEPSPHEDPTSGEEPTVNTEEPTSETEEPSSETAEPATPTELPTSNTEEPTVNTEEPTLITEEPATPTEEPTLITEEPVTPTPEPPATEQPDEPKPGTIEYYEKYAYTCTVSTDARITPSLYTGSKDEPFAIKDFYYTSRTPGGEPARENGEIWLYLKPLKGYSIFSVKVEGSYSELEDLGRDIYHIKGVKSNLKVTASSTLTPVSSDGSSLFGSYGYGIGDDGMLKLSWSENEEEPIRYVEIKISDGSGKRSKVYDGELGGCDYMKISKDVIYTVEMQCYGYNHVGNTVSINTCYMPEVRDVAFPRVEITTEDYVWPTCDYVSPPAGNIGAGINNATWEKSIVKIYDASNTVVYDSSAEHHSEGDYDGAKIKIRGNTSAYGIKKPYKIKLSRKCDLLAPFIDRPNDGKSYADKEWLLLNYGTDIYRIAGDAIADTVGTPWSPDYTYVALYVNGDFRGLYVLSECVKQGTGEGDSRWRCPVEDDGYIIEYDAYWWNEPLYFTTPSTVSFVMKYTFKYPDTDDIDKNSEAYKYIRKYMIELEQALARNDSSYLDYIDLDSFVSWILVADYMCLLDSGGNNLFMWKKDSTENSKIVMGPNWDFDSWKWQTESFANIHRDGSHFYFPALSKKPEFAQAYVGLFHETYDKVADAVNEALDKIDEKAYNKLYRIEAARYQSTYSTLSAMRRSFNNWIKGHISWMVSQIG